VHDRGEEVNSYQRGGETRLKALHFSLYFLEKYFQQAWTAIKCSLFDVFRQEKTHLLNTAFTVLETNLLLFSLLWKEKNKSLVSKYTGRVIVWPEINP